MFCRSQAVCISTSVHGAISPAWPMLLTSVPSPSATAARTTTAPSHHSAGSGRTSLAEGTEARTSMAR